MRATHTSLVVVVAVAALLAGCAESSTPMAPREISFQAVNPASAPSPFTAQIFNPCNGELVDISGTIQLRYDVRSDANGGSHTVGRILENGSGIGEVTGASYAFHVDSIITANSQEIQFGVSQIVVVRLIGQGQVPNFLGTQVLHFVVNPNGDLVGVVDDFRGDCR